MNANGGSDELKLIMDDGDEIPLVSPLADVATKTPIAATRPMTPPVVTPTSAPQSEGSSVAEPVAAAVVPPAPVASPAPVVAQAAAEEPSAAPSLHPEISLLDEAVAAAVEASDAAPTDPDLRRRFSGIVALYFRDLRDTLETVSKMTMPVASGGMGFDQATAEKAVSGLAVRRTEYHAGHVERAADSKIKFVAERAAKHLTEGEAAQAADQVKLEGAYAELMKKAGLAAPVTSPVAPAEPRVIPVVAAPKPIPVKLEPAVSEPSIASAAQPEIKAAAVIAPLVVETPDEIKPVAKSIGAPPSNLPVAPLEDEELVVASPEATPLTPSAPVPPSVAVKSAPSVPPPSAPAAAPVMTDIRSAPRLVGPVDELRVLNLEDFRRLSKDPREATLKIKDKIDLLSEQDYEHRTQGIKAFVESAVNRLYLDVLRTSLEGTPVLDVIAAMEARGAKTLNKAEFDALMELNRTLRFG